MRLPPSRCSLMSRAIRRGGEEVVGRDVEEALDLAGMEIQGQHAVDAAWVIMLATSLAEIGVRAAGFRSCRA